VPADEQAVADEFEVIFTDEDGEVVHRNATPPARHYALRADAAHGGQWEGLFLVTDHMEVDHMHGWLTLSETADGEVVSLVVEPVIPSELTPDYCPHGEHEHVVYVESTIGPVLVHEHTHHDDDDLSELTHEGSSHARRQLRGWSVTTNETVGVYEDDAVFLAPGPSPAGDVVVTEISAAELLARAPNCGSATINFEADSSMQSAVGSGAVGRMLGAISGMNKMYNKAGISCKAGKVVVSGKNYGGTIAKGLLKTWRAGASVGGGAACVLATGSKGSGPVVGRAYQGGVCGGANHAVVNGLSGSMYKITGHEVGHVMGVSHTSCGDFMGAKMGSDTPCSSTASQLASAAAKVRLRERDRRWPAALQDDLTF